MSKFAKFNKAIDADIKSGIAKAKEENGTGDFPKIPKGKYVGHFAKLAVGECGSNAKIPGAPLLKVDFVIDEGDFKKHHVFMNKALYTDRNDEKWNLSRLMAGILGWLESLEPSADVDDIAFENYDQLEDLILDIAEDISEVSYEIFYDEDAFNSIHIEDIYE